MNSPSQTNLSLLSRLRHQPDDYHSWQTFVSIYGPRIKAWCKNWGLQASDADDVAQDVLLALAKQMKEFEYDPKGRFRSWLKTIAYRAWVDFVKKRKPEVQAPENGSLDAILEKTETQNDFLTRMDDESERLLLEEAMLNVRKRVENNSWRAFEMTAIEGKSGQETAAHLEMPVTAIYKAKSRIQEMLRSEIRKLDQPFFAEPD